MFIKYVIISGIAYGIDLATYAALVMLHPSVNLIAASMIGKIISSIFSFFMHHLFTFKNQAQQSTLSQQAWRYYVLVALNIPFSACMLSIMLIFIPSPFLAKISADGFCICISFILSKYKIFTAIH